MKSLLAELAKYRKTVVAVLGSALTWFGASYVPDAHIDRAEVFAGLVAIATAMGVYGISNASKDE